MSKSNRSSSWLQATWLQAEVDDLGAPCSQNKVIDDLYAASRLYDKVVNQWKRKLRHGHWTRVTDLTASISEESCETYLGLHPELHAPQAHLIDFARDQIAEWALSLLLNVHHYEEWQSTDKHKVRRPICNRSTRSSKDPGRQKAALLARFRGPDCSLCHNDIGEFHVKGCHAELCPWCGEGAIECTCRTRKQFKGIPADERLRIDGYFLASREACEFGWYCHLGRDAKPIRCGPFDHPDVCPDFDRVMKEAFWDRQQQCYVKPDWMK